MVDVSKTNVVAMIKAALVDPVNNIVNKWATDNDPTGVATAGYNPRPLNVDMDAGQVITTRPLTSEITDLNIGRANLIQLMADVAQLMTVVRKVRLLRSNYPYVDYFIDITNPTRMNSSFAFPTPATLLPASSTMTGPLGLAEFQSYLTTLSDQITAWRDTVLTYTELYCHSNCHDACHSNRGRR